MFPEEERCLERNL